MPTDSFGTVSTVRESPKQLREFVNYHLNAGASYVVVYFDDPHDPAIPQFANEPRVISRACDDQHWISLLGRPPDSTREALNRNLQDGAGILRECGVAWISSIDADELLYSARSIPELLSEVDSNVDIVRARSFEAMGHRGMSKSLEFASSCFRRFPTMLSPAQQPAAGKYGTSLKIFTEQGCFGHVQGKTLFRAGAEVHSYHSHAVRNARRVLRDFVSEELLLLHFDAINFENWGRKWLRRIRGGKSFPGMTERRKNQQIFLEQVYETEGEKGLKRVFREWNYCSSAEIMVMEAAGLLRRVEIPPVCFEVPVNDESLESAQH